MANKFRDNPGLQRMPKSELEWTNFINEAAKWIADSVALATAQTDIVTAQTQADYSGYSGIGESVVLKTDASGTQPANNTTADLIAVFKDEDGTQIASRTLRGTYTTAADTIAVTAQSTSGEATTYSVSGDGTDSPSAVVTHTASEAIAVLAWVFSDLTTAGKDPSTGGGK